MRTQTLALCLLFIFSSSYAQRLMENGIPVYQRSLSNHDASIQNFEYIPKKPGHYTAEDWQAVIDSTWGEGLSTADKLKIFDIFWDEIDDGYPAFFNIDVDWNLLRETYRPDVAAGVSRGRFNAIMNILASVLEDHHTSICDVFVSRDSLRSGVPIFVPTGYQSAINLDFYGDEFCHFGASLAPMEDSSLFVYGVIENHPLDLQIGDLVLGYDGGNVG